ncbi:MAG: energy transducer TonB [Terracidiphilus sp.]|jgi:protein TonB
MKVVACFVLLSASLTSGARAQSKPNSNAPPAGVELISSGVAEKLLLHKAALTCPHTVMPSRVTGTVVLAILIDTNGNVVHPTIVSGPAMLRKPVLDAIRKYKYKPYLLNDKAVDAETTVSVTVDSYRDCPIAQ